MVNVICVNTTEVSTENASYGTYQGSVGCRSTPLTLSDLWKNSLCSKARKTCIQSGLKCTSKGLAALGGVTKLQAYSSAVMREAVQQSSDLDVQL